MQSHHSLEFERWSISRSKIRDATTSKKCEPRANQKYPIRTTQYVPTLSASLQPIRAKPHPIKSSQAVQKGKVDSSQKKHEERMQRRSSNIQLLQRLQTCFKDKVESPKAMKDSLNASISLTHLQSDYYEPESKVECTTTISNYIDTLDIKSTWEVNNNNNNMHVSSQTDQNNCSNCSQVCVKMRNTTTQMKALQDQDEYNELWKRITCDCDNLITILKMHEHRRKIQGVFSIQSFRCKHPTYYNQNQQEFANDCETKEFMCIFEELFTTQGNLLEDCLFTNDSSSEVTVSKNKQQPVGIINDAIENSNKLINELNIITNALQKSFEAFRSVINTKNRGLELSHSDYKTVSEETITDEVELKHDSNEEHTQIKSSIAKVSAELFTILEQMKSFEELQTRAKDSLNKMHQDDNNIKHINSADKIENCSNTKDKNKDKRKLRISKSHSDIFLCYNLKEDKEENIKEDIKEWLLKKSSDDSSNFSTCSEISDFESIITDVNTEAKERRHIQTVVSSVSTNTDDYESLTKNTFTGFAKYKTSRSSKRHKRQRRPMIIKTVEKQTSPSKVICKMSDYHATFATCTKSCQMQSRNKKFVVVSQSPSVGDVKFVCKVCKEFDKDSAIIMNSSYSCEENDGNHDIKTAVSTAYPETSLTNDTSNITIVEELSLNEAKCCKTEGNLNKSEKPEEKAISTQSDTKTSCTDTGCQKDIACCDVNVQSKIGIQNQVAQTDKDISSADMFDSTHSICEELPPPPPPPPQPIKPRDVSEDCLSVIKRSGDLTVDLGDDLKTAVKEKCARYPQNLADTVMTRLEKTFKDNNIDLTRIKFERYVPKTDFCITSVRCIGENSVLIKWESKLTKIHRFEIFIDNILKTKIHSSKRSSAVIDFVQPKSVLLICVCAMSEKGELGGMAKATFKMA